MAAKPEVVQKAGREIVNHLLSEHGGNDFYADEERAEVESARSILAALKRLQSSLPDPSPEQQHDITSIRAAANSLIRNHRA